MTGTTIPESLDLDAGSVLGIMAKFWEPGKVKTRLGKAIGLQKAAQVHCAFVLHLARTLENAAKRSVFVVAPPQSAEVFEAEIDGGWTTVPQSDGDLGNRMCAWFQQSLADHSTSVLIGADCPTLSHDEIGDARVALRDHDVVLGPAIDGGYYLIGLRGPWKESYQSIWCDIAWSTDQVFRATCRRITALGLSLAELPPMEDVDTITELGRLRARLAESNDADDLSLATRLNDILDQDPES